MGPYAAPAATISAATWPWAPGLDGDVEEARPGDLDRGHAVGCAVSRACDQLGERARVGAGLLGQLQRDVGGVVAVTLLPRALHRHRRRDAVGQGQRTLVDERRQDVDDRGGELLRGSPAKGIGAAVADPEPVSLPADGGR